LPWIFLASLAALAACGDAGKRDTPVVRQGAIGVKFLADHTIKSGTQVTGTRFGGISGIEGLDGDTYLLLSDDGSTHQPARMYRTRISLEEGGLTIGAPKSTFLLRPDGSLFPKRDDGTPADPEALRFDPRTKTLLWTSEGDIKHGAPPFVREMTETGKHVRELAIPSLLAEASDGRGPRHNGSLESLTLVPGEDRVVVALELPLVQDGTPPTLEKKRSPIRLVELGLHDAAGRQYVYELDPVAIPPDPPEGFSVNGVVELLALSPNRFLVLERSFSAGRGNTVRLYEASTERATDVSKHDSLQGVDYAPVTKREVVNFKDLPLASVDNLEGMAFGPPLANGNRTLLVVSDDNFNDHQVTQFIALELLEDE